MVFQERWYDMIGVLIATHGNFSTEIVKSAELIMGRQQKVKTLTLNHGDNVEALREDIRKSIKELDDGEGVLVLTDFFGGSPTNATLFNLKDLDFRAITGVNLPMLLDLFCFRDELDIEALAKRVMNAGVEGIKDLNEALAL